MRMVPTAPFLLAITLALAALAGCPDDDDSFADDDTGTSDDDDAVSLCADPWTSGPRMRDEGLARGMDVRTFHPSDIGEDVQGGHASLVAADLDADGDTDVITYVTLQGLLAWENDGTGHFEAHDGLIHHGGEPIIGVAAVDLDGDRLPEIVQSSWGRLGINHNRGDWDFDSVDMFHVEPENEFLVGSFHFGDLDADGDLDLFAPVQVPLETELPLAVHNVMLQDEEGNFVPRNAVQGAHELLDTQATMVVDYDRDGRQDIVFPGDQGHTSALFHNDGPDGDGVPTFTDVAEETGWAIDFAVMGIDGADVNRDGVLDFIVGDIGPPDLLLSAGEAWIESGSALGLWPDVWQYQDGTIGWTVDFSDMDNDSWLDVVQASGPHEGDMDLDDLFFIATGDGTWQDLTQEWGVGGIAAHYGMATADFDGDGFLDYVTTGMGQYPYLLMNTCDENAWIEIDLAGPPKNSEGWGSIVELDGPAGSQMQVLTNLRGQSQRPAVLHFGLGSHPDPVDVMVTWPDGAQTREEGLLPFGRRRIEHPGR